MAGWQFAAGWGAARGAEGACLMALRSLILLSVLSAVGCDPLYRARIDLREGPVQSVKLVPWHATDELGGQPVGGAEFECWSVGAGERTPSVMVSPPNGTIQFATIGEFFGPWMWRFRCRKPGYEPVEGEWDLYAAGKGHVHKILVITMKRAGEAP